MQDGYHTLISLLLPDFNLDLFELKEEDVFHLELQEVNITPNVPDGERLLSKGFFPTITVQVRRKVTEITLDMAGNMELIAKRCFRSAVRVTDRFHVQKLATEALQEMRIKYRWEAIDAENDAIDQARKAKKPFHAEVLSNRDTLKQLLARSRYALYRRPDAWSPSQ